MALNSKRRKELGLGKIPEKRRKKWGNVKKVAIPIPLEPINTNTYTPNFREVIEDIEVKPGRNSWYGIPRPLVRTR